MENMKLKQLRDVILAIMIKEKLSIEETKQVLRMCDDEVEAWERRGKLAEIKRMVKSNGKVVN